MLDDANSNERAGAATSPTGRPSATSAEADSIASQADDARRALSRALAEMRRTAAQAGDVRAWAREYPWTSVAAAAALGFLSVRALSSKPTRQASDGLLERVLADEQIARRVHQLANTPGPPMSDSILASLATMLLQTIGASLESAFLSAMTRQSASRSSTDEGQAPSESADPDQPSSTSAD